MWRVLRSRDGWELPGTFSCSRRPSQLPTLPFRDLSTDCHSTPIRSGKIGELRFGRMQEREDRSAGEERILHPKRTTVFISLVTGKESFVSCSSLTLTLSFQCPWEDAQVYTQKEKRWRLSLLWHLCWWMRKPQHSAQTWIFLSVFLHTRKF